MKLRPFLILLAALAAVRLALMATTPVFDPSEARYAAISANMARTGDFVVPHFTYRGVYQSFDGKPPLVFQAGGLFCRAFGVTEFAVRLFPLLSAALLLLILYASVRREAGPAAGRLAVLVCATCVAFYGAAGIAMTDISLTCCVAGALLLYRSFLEGFRFRHAAGVAALLGAGMIVKGPVSLVLFALPVAVDAIVNRRVRGIFNWKWLAVAPIYFLIAVPWFVLVETRNPGSVWYFFYNENFLRFLVHDYGDKYGAGREAFRGVSVLWAIVCILPWGLLVPLKRPEWRRFDFLAFASIVGFWCLTSRVLIYYLFPVIPLFASYVAVCGRRELMVRLAPWFSGLAAIGIAGALVVGMFATDKMEGARGTYRPGANRYSYEFYHGTPPGALAK